MPGAYSEFSRDTEHTLIMPYSLLRVLVGRKEAFEEVEVDSYLPRSSSLLFSTPSTIISPFSLPTPTLPPIHFHQQSDGASSHRIVGFDHILKFGLLHSSNLKNA